MKLELKFDLRELLNWLNLPQLIHNTKLRNKSKEAKIIEPSFWIKITIEKFYKTEKNHQDGSIQRFQTTYSHGCQDLAIHPDSKLSREGNNSKSAIFSKTLYKLCNMRIVTFVARINFWSLIFDSYIIYRRLVIRFHERIRSVNALVVVCHHFLALLYPWNVITFENNESNRGVIARVYKEKGPYADFKCLWRLKI